MTDPKQPLRELTAARNAAWTLAVRVVRSQGVSNTRVWHRVRHWFDGVAGMQLTRGADVIVRRYYAEMVADAVEKIEEWKQTSTAKGES